MRETVSHIKDCPERPPCPACGMKMLTVKHFHSDDDREQCLFECMRCGHAELSQPAKYGER